MEDSGLGNGGSGGIGGRGPARPRGGSGGGLGKRNKSTPSVVVVVVVGGGICGGFELDVEVELEEEVDDDSVGGWRMGIVGAVFGGGVDLNCGCD